MLVPVPYAEPNALQITMINLHGLTYMEIENYWFSPKMDLGPVREDGSRQIFREYPGIYCYSLEGHEGECTEDEMKQFFTTKREVERLSWAK